MSALGEAFWRLLGDVRIRERPRFLFFAVLATLLGLAQTLGLVGVEALFLAHFGAARLPETFIAASAVTVLGSVLYAARVGQERNDRLFVSMLLGAAAALALATAGIRAGLLWTLPALFCVYYLTQCVFVNHLWTFTGDYFDTVTSKRLLPLFTIGASVGGFLGGLVAVLVTRLLGPVSLIASWAAFLLAGAVLLRAGRRHLRRWGPLELEEADETSVAGLRGAMRYLGSSSLARWLVLSALGMVLALFVAQYLYSDIFARTFRTPEALASFFGIYLAITNLLEIGIEVAITPWLIRRLGVASANLVHPLLTLLSFGGMALRFNVASGVAARVNRELIENAVAGPVRALIQNALPLRVRGRMRALLEGIVVHAGMSAAGIVLLALGRPDPRWLFFAGATTALLYLVANLGARREYLRTLVQELRAGRLDLSEVGEDIGAWEAARLAELWEQLLREEGSRPSRSLLQLIPALAARGIVDPLVRAATHPSAAVRRACIEALAGSPGERTASSLLRALDDSDPGVRLAALRGAHRRAPDSPELATRARARLHDRDAVVRAEAAGFADAEGVPILEAMIRSSTASDAVAALRVAPPALLEAALERIRDRDPAIRAEAMECVARLAAVPPLPIAELEEALRDGDARIRRGAVALLAKLDGAEARSALAGALADTSPEVQAAAERALGSMAEAGVDAARPYLRDPHQRAVEGALRVVAAGGGQRSRELLCQQLRRYAGELWYDLIAYQHLPADAALGNRFLRSAYRDTLMRNLRLAFSVLALLEEAIVVRKVEKVLRFGSPQARGDALEVLSNLGDRESAQLLVLLHEDGPLEDRIEAVARLLPLPASAPDAIEASHRSEVRWIRMGARALQAPADPGEEEIMERLLALKQIPLFAHLSLEQVEAVHRIAREVEYLPNEVIVREGDPGGELFLLIEGGVRVFKNHGSPNPTLLSTLTAVSYFGEMAILDDEPRSATVVATGRARLLTLDGRNLKELIHQMPEISFEIFRVLTARVRAAERRLGER